MKTRFCVLGILLVVMLAANAQQPPSDENQQPSTPTPRPSCEGKNLLLPKLGQHQVLLFPDVSLDQRGLCHKEWTQHGTCCEQETTRVFVEKTRAENQAALQDMQVEISMLDHNMFQLMDSQLKGVQASYDVYAISRKVRDNIIEKLLNAKTLPALKRATHILISILTKWKGDMLAKNQRCMEKLNLVLAAGTCSICSGRSEQFFQGGRIKMSEPYCRSILDECGASWYRMVSLVQMVKRVSAIIRAVSAETSVSIQSKTFTKAISKFADVLKIKETFESCDNFETCPYSKVSMLCESFITFVGDSYLTAVVSRSIPGLLGLSQAPSEEIKETSDQLDFLVHSSQLIFQKYTLAMKSNMQRSSSSSSEMPKSALVKYLSNMAQNILKRQNRIAELTDNFKIHNLAINPTLIKKSQGMILQLKHFIKDQPIPQGNPLSKDISNGSSAGSKRIHKKSKLLKSQSRPSHKEQSISKPKLRRAKGSDAPKREYASKQNWNLGSGSRASRKNHGPNSKLASGSVRAGITATKTVVAPKKQSRKSTGDIPAKISTPHVGDRTVTLPRPRTAAPIRSQPATGDRKPQAAPARPKVSQAPARPAKKGRKLAAFIAAKLDTSHYKQTMVVRGCDLERCLGPMMEP